jgi:succinate dehydrogenase/fumarate reductase flavoprotein subunit
MYRVSTSYDVLVIGAGNAALCAALAAQDRGARVLVLERAPEHLRGGNTYFTGGGFRFPYAGLDDIRRLIPDLAETEARSIDVGSYTPSQMYGDMMRVSENLADDLLTDTIVRQAYPTMLWLRERGVRWVLQYGRQAFTVDGVLALDVGAMSYGHWSGCHAVAWDLNAPAYGNRSIGDLYQKHSYPFGIVVNVDGARFVDEGADYRNYTYARYGREILKQPQRAAFQIFDAKAAPFTFGGLRIDAQARVLDGDERPIPGLFAAGELVGGLFYFNYAGGSGLMAGAVFGKLAGDSAADSAGR